MSGAKKRTEAQLHASDGGYERISSGSSSRPVRISFDFRRLERMRERIGSEIRRRYRRNRQEKET